jgi:7-carboxy-7-deazaguanine synthase
LEHILEKTASFKCPYVCVTGGEPLAQPGCIPLLKKLCDQGYSVSLETSGARPLDHVDPRVMIVMDLKTPDSGEDDKNLLTNLAFLKPSDQIKLVLCSRNDYEWACHMLSQHRLTEYAQVLFSPSHQQLDPTHLANWILQDKLPVRFQFQLHKLLWNDTPGH